MVLPLQVYRRPHAARQDGQPVNLEAPLPAAHDATLYSTRGLAAIQSWTSCLVVPDPARRAQGHGCGEPASFHESPQNPLGFGWCAGTFRLR